MSLTSRLFLELAVVLVSVGIAWASLNGRVTQNTKGVTATNVTVKTLSEKHAVLNDALLEIKGDLKVIRVQLVTVTKGIDEIKLDIREILRDDTSSN